MLRASANEIGRESEGVVGTNCSESQLATLLCQPIYI
jgi:hypothetical protein